MKQRRGLDRNNVLQHLKSSRMYEQHHHRKSEAKDNHSLNTDGPSNKLKSSGYIKATKCIALGWSLIQRGCAVKEGSKVIIGLITKHADCSYMYSQYVGSVLLLFSTDQKNQSYSLIQLSW